MWWGVEESCWGSLRSRNAHVSFPSSAPPLGPSPLSQGHSPACAHNPITDESELSLPVPLLLLLTPFPGKGTDREEKAVVLSWPDSQLTQHLSLKRNIMTHFTVPIDIKTVSPRTGI